jgi:hypothetical protein
MLQKMGKQLIPSPTPAEYRGQMRRLVTPKWTWDVEHAAAMGRADKKAMVAVTAAALCHIPELHQTRKELKVKQLAVTPVKLDVRQYGFMIEIWSWLNVLGAEPGPTGLKQIGLDFKEEQQRMLEEQRFIAEQDRLLQEQMK